MNIIPRPVGGVSRRINISPDEECLASQMELTKTEANQKLYCDILNTVGTLCDHYFPYQKDMHPASPSKDTLFEDAVRVHPILKTYENMWPISTMLSMHRQLRRNGSSAGITGREPISCVSGGNRQKSLKLISRSSPRKNEKTKSHLAKDRRRNTPKSGSNWHASRVHTAVSTVVASRTPSSAIANEPTRNGNYIQQFLRSLPQDLSDLLSVFVGYGVGDESALRGLLCIQGWRRWLYGWVSAGQLTELQFKMISDGLGAI